MSVNDPHSNNISDGSSVNLPAVSGTGGHLTAMPTNAIGWNGSTAGEEELNLKRLFHALRRRWLIASLTGMIAAISLVGVLYFAFPVSFEAESLVRVRRDKQTVLSKRDFGNNMHDYETFKKTQAALMKSTFVINAALRKPGLAQLPMIKREEDQAVWLAENMRVANPQNSEILSITLKGEDREDIKKLVDAVVDSYLQEIVQSEREADLERLDILKRTSRKHMQDIKEKQELIAKLAQEVGSPDSDEAELKHRLEFDALMRMKSRRDELEETVQQVQADLIVLGRRAEVAYTPTEYEIEDYLDTDPWYADAKVRLVLAQNEQRTMAARGGAPSPRLQLELQAAYAEVQRIKTQLRPRIVDRIRRLAGHDESKTTDLMSMLQTQNSIYGEQLKRVHENYLKQSETLEESIGSSAELELRKTELDNMSRMMETVSTEMETVDLNLKTKPRISKIQPAIVPEISDWILRFTLFGIAFAVTLGGTAFGVAMLEYQARRVNVTDDINMETSIHVVGSLPALHSPRVWPFGGLRGSTLESALTECIDSVRTALLCRDTNNPVDVVMVTSATAQEGKTTVANQLAISLARTGRRTLLVDGDLHNPQQHYLFRLPFGPGFCELLRKEATLDEVVQHVSVEGLSFINTGYNDPASLQALASDQVQKVLGQLRSEFDFIVIDTGPVLVGADSLLLGQHADTSLVSVRRDVSRIPKINEACDRLRAVGVDVMGAVISGVGVEFRPAQFGANVDIDDQEQSEGDIFEV